MRQKADIEDRFELSSGIEAFNLSIFSLCFNRADEAARLYVVLVYADAFELADCLYGLVESAGAGDDEYGGVIHGFRSGEGMNTNSF